MIVENPFPADSRVRKEAYYLKKSYRMTVIAIKGKSERFYEQVDGITIFRIPELPNANLGKVRYALQYFYFTFCAIILFLCSLPFKRYKVVHVHNPPDTLFFVGILCKIFAIKFIFDHHDLAPNLYLTRFSGKKDITHKVLILCEKFSCKVADVIIATNETYKQIEIDRHNVPARKIYIVRNNPIIEDCLLANTGSNERPTQITENGKKVLLFIGSINPQDGVNVLLQSLHYLVHKLHENNLICNIIGGGDSLHESKQIASKLNLDEYVNFTGAIYDREMIKEHLYVADIGVEPAPKNELNIHSTFIKVMEYMAAGIPIVAFDLKETRYSAKDSALLVPPNDIEVFAENIQKLLNDADLCERLGKAGLNRITNELNWDNAAKNLAEAYKTLSIS